jgi:hypothetical protein
MCRVADRWGAAFCLSACLNQLVQLPDKDLTCDQLAQLLPHLPKSARQLPQYVAWQEKVMRILVSSAKSSTSMSGSIEYLLFHLFPDVPALLTSPAKLELFNQVPFEAINTWAASDDLVVDSENSVVVAFGSWITAQKECSTEQKKELSSLVRVKHLTPGMLCLWCCSMHEGSRLGSMNLLGWIVLSSPTLSHCLHRFRFHDLHAPQARVVPA